MKRKLHGFSGQTALPLILMISAIIIEVAITGAFVSYFTSATALGERLSARALAAANLGIRDAEIKIVRNKDFLPTVNPYTLVSGEDGVEVDVTRATDNPNNIYIYTIEATGSASSRQKKLVATIVVDQTTGKISQQSVKEVSF